MKKILFSVLSLLICLIGLSAAKYSTNQEECADGVCFVPQYDEEGKQVYAVVSPVGYHDVPMIKQAKRLDSLKGKTIALVGGSFMANTTQNEIKKCIKSNFLKHFKFINFKLRVKRFLCLL